MTIIKSNSVENNTTFESKICIIGSGMSAQIIAYALKNKNIILVESGKINYDESIQNLNHYDEEGLKFRKDHKNRIRQLGGSANLWANQLMTLDKDDIEERDWVINDFAWPISYYELEKYYEKISNIIYKKSFNKNIFSEFFPEKYKNEEFQNYFTNSGEFIFKNHFWPSKVENFNLKSNLTLNLLNSKNLRFIENFTCTNLNVFEGTNKVNNIDIQSETKKCKIKSNIYILACGALENARIILNNEKKKPIIPQSQYWKVFYGSSKKNFGFFKIKKKNYY